MDSWCGRTGRTYSDQRTRSLLRDYHVGGFIFFARNIQSSEQTLALVESLNRANPGRLPLLLAVDEEGGRVSRLPQEFVQLPANREVGQGGAALAGRLGQLLAQRVKAMGFNVNFAPVLDVDSNPANPVIGPRSFGPDPALVARMGIAAMQGIQSRRVAPAIKHFPGHGDTSVDSHLGLPRVEADLDRLRNFELIPFREAIQAGADMVMTAHILLPELDPDFPATLSPVLIGEVLRGELQFGGVVITDDLTMAAIKDNYDLGRAAVLAIKAGVDMVLVCHGHENYVSVLEAIRSAVLAGEIPQAIIDASVTRITELKKRYAVAGEVPTVEACNRLALEIFGD